MGKIIKSSILIVLCLLIVGMGSCSTTHNKPSPQKAEKTAEYWFNLGNDYYEAGKYKDAIEAYKQAITINTDFVNSYYNLGNAYRKSGMYKESIESNKQAIKINPDYADAYYSLGVAYNKLGNHQEAIEAFKKAIAIHPDYAGHAGIHYNLGFAYSNLGKYREAIDAFKQATKTKPDFVVAYVLLGGVYLKIDKYQEALVTFKKAVKIKPDFALAHYGLGTSYYELGKYKEAIKWLEYASEEGNEEATNQLAWLLATCPDDDIRDGKRAIDIMQPLIDDVETNPNMIDTLAAAYAEIGKFSKAIKLMHEAIEKTDKNKAPEFYKELRLHLQSFENKQPWREK